MSGRAASPVPQPPHEHRDEQRGTDEGQEDTPIGPDELTQRLQRDLTQRLQHDVEVLRFTSCCAKAEEPSRSTSVDQR
jgi:5-bromo-4-chloroindolyl phosphate hydrolysis protein